MTWIARYLRVLCFLALMGCTHGPDNGQTLELLRQMGFRDAKITEGRVYVTATELLAERNNTLGEAKLIELASHQWVGSNSDNSKTLRVAALVTLARESPAKAAKHIEDALEEEDPLIRQGALAAIDVQPAVREQFRKLLQRIAHEDSRPQIADHATNLLREMNDK